MKIEIPADAGFETLAGFLLFRLGEIPHVAAISVRNEPSDSGVPMKKRVVAKPGAAFQTTRRQGTATAEACAAFCHACQPSRSSRSKS